MSAKDQEKCLAQSDFLGKAWSVFGGNENRHKNRLNLVYTMLLFFNNFAFGISVNLVGVTLVDLTRLYSFTVRQAILAILVSNALGYLLGALTSALVLHTWNRIFNRQILLAGVSALIAITSLLTPHLPSSSSTSWAFITGAMFLNGMGGGAWDACHTAFLVDMWPEVGANGPVLQANQFFYSAGATVSPLLASRFIFGELNEILSVDGSGFVKLTPQLRQKFLSVPFAVNGAVQFVAPALLLLLYFTQYRYRLPSTQIACLPKPKNSLTGLDCVKTIGDHLAKKNLTDKNSTKIAHRKLKLALCGLCIAAYFTAETGYFQYCTAMFQYLDVVQLSASEAAHITSVLSFFYTIGPFFSALISVWLAPDTILVYHYACLLGGFTVLALGSTGVLQSRHNLALVYGTSGLIGYGFSAVIPALYSFVQRHFGLDDRVCGLFAFVSGTFSLAIPLGLVVVSSSGEAAFEQQPMLLIYLQLGFIAASLAVFALLRLWISVEKRRRK